MAAAPTAVLEMKSVASLRVMDILLTPESVQDTECNFGAYYMVLDEMCPAVLEIQFDSHKTAPYLSKLDLEGGTDKAYFVVGKAHFEVGMARYVLDKAHFESDKKTGREILD